MLRKEAETIVTLLDYIEDIIPIPCNPQELLYKYLTNVHKIPDIDCVYKERNFIKFVNESSLAPSVKDILLNCATTPHVYDADILISPRKVFKTFHDCFVFLERVAEISEIQTLYWHGGTGYTQEEFNKKHKDKIPYKDSLCYLDIDSHNAYWYTHFKVLLTDYDFIAEIRLQVDKSTDEFKATAIYREEGYGHNKRRVLDSWKVEHKFDLNTKIINMWTNTGYHKRLVVF